MNLPLGTKYYVFLFIFHIFMNFPEPRQTFFKSHNKTLTLRPKAPTLWVKRCGIERTKCPPIAGSGYRPWLGFAVGTALTDR